MYNTGIYVGRGSGGGGGGGKTQFAAITPSNSIYPILTGALDGSNSVFTVPGNKYIAGNLVVYYNGAMQSDFVETNPGTGIFTMGFIPGAASDGNELFVTYYQA